VIRRTLLIKGIEYGCLGLTIAWVSRRSWGGAGAHAAAGLAVGILFGGAILVLQYGSGSTSVAELFPGAINELLFPVGCSLVLFSGGVVGKMAVREDTE
jgi:predicted phage tail protein